MFSRDILFCFSMGLVPNVQLDQYFQDLIIFSMAL
jgi:hypothetical protein